MKHFFTVLLFSVLAFAVCSLARAGIRRATPKLYAAIWSAPPAAIAASLNKEASSIGENAKTPSEKNSSSRSKAPLIENPPEPLWVTGIAYTFRNVNITLSDGRTITERDNIPGEPRTLQRIERNFVIVDGRRIYFKAGAGVRVTPDKSTTVAPVEGQPAGMPLDQQAAQTTNETPPPQSNSDSSWVVGMDGVSRLVKRDTREIDTYTPVGRTKPANGARKVR